MRLIKRSYEIIRNEGFLEFSVRGKQFIGHKISDQYLKLQKIIKNPEELEVSKLLTQNRGDIDYRISFLEKVIELNYPIDQTLYYHFISDPERWAYRQPEEQCKKFIEVYKDIKKNDIQKPVIATHITDEKINTTVKTPEKKTIEIENKTGYQLIDGAHRVAIYKYLNYKKIPVYLIKKPNFEFPNYSKFIEKREKHYKNKIKKEE